MYGYLGNYKCKDMSFLKTHVKNKDYDSVLYLKTFSVAFVAVFLHLQLSFVSSKLQQKNSKDLKLNKRNISDRALHGARKDFKKMCSALRLKSFV